MGFSIAYFQLSSKLHSQLLEEKKILHLEGEVRSLKYAKNGQVFLLNTAKYGLIRLNSNRCYDVSKGDEISVKASLYPFATTMLPYGYNFALYSKLSGIYANGYIYQTPKVIKPAKSSNIISNIRKKIRTAILEHLPKETAGVATALMIGEAKTISEETSGRMRNAGIAHILCVSGLHLSLIAMVAYICIRLILSFFCGLYTQRYAAIGAIIASGLYWMISGMSVATTRAYIMTFVMLFSMLISRNPKPMRSLGLASFIVLVLNPQEAISPSFQMSFSAVMILLSCYNTEPPFCKKYYIFRYIYMNIYSSFMVSVIIAPVAMKSFFTFSVYSVIANLMVVPMMSFIVMPLTFFSLIFIFLSYAKWPLYLLSFFIKIIIEISSYISQLPLAVYYHGYIGDMNMFIFILGLFWFSIFRSRVRLAGIYVMVISIILIVLSSKPNIIIDCRRQLVAIKEKKEYVIYGQKITKSQKQYWAGWLGQKDIEFKYSDLESIESYNYKIYFSKYNDILKVNAYKGGEGLICKDAYGDSSILFID